VGTIILNYMSKLPTLQSLETKYSLSPRYREDEATYLAAILNTASVLDTVFTSQLATVANKITSKYKNSVHAERADL
jgi:hypothetical protein